MITNIPFPTGKPAQVLFPTATAQFPSRTQPATPPTHEVWLRNADGSYGFMCGVTSTTNAAAEAVAESRHPGFYATSVDNLADSSGVPMRRSAFSL